MDCALPTRRKALQSKNQSDKQRHHLKNVSFVVISKTNPAIAPMAAKLLKRMP
jgi:hypothetical protein